MKPSRHKIAAAVTVGALGALATVALAAGGEPQRRPSAAPASAVTQPAAEVRTEIIRETVHRRARGHRSTQRAAASSSSRVASRSVASPSATRSAPVAVAPVATPDARRSRGADDPASDDHGGHGGDDGGHHEADVEVEHHGGDD